MRHALPLAVAATGAALLLSGCGTVAVHDEHLSGAAATACERLVAALPDEIGTARRRGADGDLGAAYGDPPIVLRCGVADPSLATDCLDVGGVQWSPQEAQGGVVLYTIGRTPTVELLVPTAYRTDNAWLADLGPAVAKHTTLGASC